MISYVTLGTNDLERAAKFYDALLAEFGGRRIMEYDRGIGATDEGPAGPRGDEFYAGYFRDSDGNTLNVFCFG